MLAVVEAVSLLRSVSLTGKRNRDGHGKRRRGHGGEGEVVGDSLQIGRDWAGVDPRARPLLPKNGGENIIAEGRRARDEKEGTYERGGVPAQVRRDR